VSPEAARGGPIGLVEEGDGIVIDLPERRLDLDVSTSELQLRRAAYESRPARVTRGYLKFYSEHVESAARGAVLPR
jgi:dihydroxy-acid dehydratase